MVRLPNRSVDRRPRNMFFVVLQQVLCIENVRILLFVFSLLFFSFGLLFFLCGFRWLIIAPLLIVLVLAHDHFSLLIHSSSKLCHLVQLISSSAIILPNHQCLRDDTNRGDLCSLLFERIFRPQPAHKIIRSFVGPVSGDCTSLQVIAGPYIVSSAVHGTYWAMSMICLVHAEATLLSGPVSPGIVAQPCSFTYLVR